MNRHVVVFCLTLAILLVGAADLSAQEKAPQFEATVESLAPNLHEIRIPPVNLLALTGPDGTLLVDAGYEQMGETLSTELGKLGNMPVRFIIDTHWHFDHVGGNIPLGKDALIIAHESVRELLSADQTILGNEVKAHAHAD